MEVIVNEVQLKKEAREQERIEKLKKEGKSEPVSEATLDAKKEVIICRTNTDIQKRKLDKLMSDPVSKFNDEKMKHFSELHKSSESSLN